jgi:putative Mn2+ efflux pump MntP
MASRSAHVDFVGLLFIIWGLLTTLIGVSTLALGVGAIALITSASRRDAGGQIAAGLTAAAFTTLAVIALVWGIAHIAVGLRLRRLNARARLAALMLGSIDLVLLPYGTALGMYALWVLLHEDGKRLFALTEGRSSP